GASGRDGSWAGRELPIAQDLAFFLAVALPPFRPAAFFWAVVPPCLELPPDPDDLPPRLDAPGELAILAARSLDIPLSFRASYCFSFFTPGRLPGIVQPLSLRFPHSPEPADDDVHALPRAGDGRRFARGLIGLRVVFGRFVPFDWIGDGRLLDFHIPIVVTGVTNLVLFSHARRPAR